MDRIKVRAVLSPSGKSFAIAHPEWYDNAEFFGEPYEALQLLGIKGTVRRPFDKRARQPLDYVSVYEMFQLEKLQEHLGDRLVGLDCTSHMLIVTCNTAQAWIDLEKACGAMSCSLVDVVDMSVSMSDQALWEFGTRMRAYGVVQQLLDHLRTR